MNKILVVEDKIDNLISTKALLGSILRDVEIITAASGREGIIKAEKEKPDVAVLNINMSGLNGLEVTKILKTSHKSSSILILLAADKNTSPEDKVKGLDFGADAIINKPFNIPELSAQIKALLRISSLESKLIKDKKQLSESLKNTGYKLKETSGLIKTIYSALPVGIGIVDNDKLVFVNAFLKNMTGIFDYLPVAADSFIENWHQIKKKIPETGGKQANFSTEILLKHSDGLPHPSLLTVAPINSGNINKYIISIMDISLEARERKLKNILLEIYTHANKFLDNSDFIKMTGNTLSSLTDTSRFYIGIYDLIENAIVIPYHSDPMYREKRLNPYGNLISLVLKNKRHIWLKHNDIMRLSGESRTSNYESKAKAWLGIPLINNGKLIGVMVFQNNENENTFSRIQVDDLALVASAIAAILETRMKNKELEKAFAKVSVSEKLKNNFLSNISHEIRTPMNAIVGFSSILYDKVPEKERIEYLDLIIRNSEHLLKIIDNIVDMAKIQSGDIKLNKINTNISAMIRDLYETTVKDIKLDRKDIEVRMLIPKSYDSVQLITDPFRLRQALENLLSNAVKFTDKGNIDLGFELKNETIEIFVRDTGIGIPENMIDKIFDKFSQIEEGHRRDFGGSGLGLSITKKLINLLNGKIKVYTQPGHGSEFRIILPFEKEKFISAENKKNSYAFNWNDKKLLLVDDVDTNLEFLDLMLSKTGATTVLADNGKKAVEIFRKDSAFDLVVMDLQMPVMDGYTATRLIKEMKPSIPVVVQTAYTELSNRRLAFESGCDAYLEKPIKADKLLETIAQFLE